MTTRWKLSKVGDENVLTCSLCKRQTTGKDTEFCPAGCERTEAKQKEEERQARAARMKPASTKTLF